MALADALVAAARALLGTPFRHQGRLPGLALDCAGTVVCAVRACGLVPVDRVDYGRIPHLGLLEKTVEENGFLEVVTDLQAGDILLMRFESDPQHLAIYTADDTIIHSYQAVGKVCEHGLSADWRRRIVKIYRIKASHV